MLNLINHRRNIFVIALLGFSVLTGVIWHFSGKLGIKELSWEERQANQVILDWFNLFLVADRYAEGYRGPISARTAAYISIAAYETGMPFFANQYISLQEVFKFSMPAYDTSIKFNLPAALNASFKTSFGKYFITAPMKVHEQMDQLFAITRNRLIPKSSLEEVKHSELFGEEMALAIYQYSSSDTAGHMAYVNIYDLNYKLPQGLGKYTESKKHPLPPLLPHWGDVRTFVVDPSKVMAKPIGNYAYDPSSVFYTEALEILTVSSPLSAENKWIAEFWSDDHPGLTFTPSTRWISIANQVVREQTLETGLLLEMYLKLNMGLADAGIACWKSKYHYCLERPETFIWNTLNPNWEPLSPAPNFPSYPSGHSIFGAVSAEVLTHFFGDHFEMTDISHKGRDEFNGKPRTFKSFYSMAFENAYSRIPLGVHFRTDCEEGLSMGFKIGKEICKLNLKTKDYSYR